MMIMVMMMVDLCLKIEEKDYNDFDYGYEKKGIKIIVFA